ncbi:MAG: glucokinase [Enhydrobacter sp.]|nr:MAG: glucokinase [Enhydrobacter sp.]
MTKVLLSDIGATRARFAVLFSGVVGPVTSLDVSDYATAADAVAEFLRRGGGGEKFDGAVFGVAGPVDGPRCAMTNARWVVDAIELQQRFALGPVRIINDLAALALALPHLGRADLRSIGPEEGRPGEPLAIVAPGTGLGMACLLRGGYGARVLTSEGGHASLAAGSAREAALVTILHRRFGHVSAERVLSGSGLVNLYEAIAELEGARPERRTPAQVTRAAVEGSCARSREALDAFCGFLGAVAGNAALMFGARGGVYIGGGIVPRIVDHLAVTSFRARFEAKGRFHRYLAAIPTKVVMKPDPAFVGLAALGSAGHG